MEVRDMAINIFGYRVLAGLTMGGLWIARGQRIGQDGSIRYVDVALGRVWFSLIQR